MSDLLAKLRRCGIDDAADEIERLTAALTKANGEWTVACAELRVRLAEADAHGKAQQQWAHAWRDKHDALTAENAALRKDAERYRWLRGSESVPAHSIRWARWEIRHWQGANGWRDLLRSELDVAIDAAMGEGHE